MSNQTAGNEANQVPESMPRTGPLGRLVRTGWFAVTAWGTYLLLAGDLADPVDPAVLKDPGFWVMTIISVFILAHSAPLIGPGNPTRLLAISGVAAAVAGAGGLAVSGAAWSPPLAWVIWSFDLLAYGSVGIGFALAVVLGTPGCEYGSYRHLAMLARGEQPTLIPSHSCAAGLDRLDSWEAHRAAAASS